MDTEFSVETIMLTGKSSEPILTYSSYTFLKKYTCSPVVWGMDSPLRANQLISILLALETRT